MKATQPPASPGRASTGKATPPSTRSETQDRENETALPATPPADHELTENAQLLETGTQAVHAAPGAKREKLEALKRAIAEGTYEVDAEEVAEKILDEHLKTPLE